MQKSTHTEAAPGINKTINFQGKMTDDNGLNVADGTYQFVFSIYTVGSGGSAVWTETVNLDVADGIFQHALGSSTALPGSVDFNTDNIFLGITFNSDPDGEMTPRIQLSASPYAFNADQLDGLDASDLVQLNPSVAQTGDIAITGSVSAAGLNLDDGSSNTASVVLAPQAGDNTYTIPDAGGNDTFCLEALANCGGSGLSASLADNTADAWDIQEGVNNYLNISTTDSSENISFGNTATNPTYGFLGSGTATFSGLVQGNSGLTASGATVNLNASSNFATNINTGTSTGAVNIGSTVAGAVAIGSSGNITLNGNGGSTGLTIGSVLVSTLSTFRFQNGGQITTPSSGSSFSQSISLTTGSAAGSVGSGNITIQTGNASGTSIDSGDITIDSGSATGTAGVVSIGATNASNLILGRSGMTTTNAGDFEADGYIAAWSGDISSGSSIQNGQLTLWGNGEMGQLWADPAMSAARIWTFPDADGEICLDSGNCGGGGVDTLAAIGSSPNANGATISGTTLTLQPASTSFGGVVTTGAQSFAGAKTFNSALTINLSGAGPTGGYNADSYIRIQNNGSNGNDSYVSITSGIQGNSGLLLGDTNNESAGFIYYDNNGDDLYISSTDEIRSTPIRIWNGDILSGSHNAGLVIQEENFVLPTISSDTKALFLGGNIASQDSGISILSGTSGLSYVALGDTADEDAGGFVYDNSTNTMYLIGSGAPQLAVSSAATNIMNGALQTAGTTRLTNGGTLQNVTYQGTAIGAAYGGTGQTTYTAGDLLYATGTTTVSRLAIGSNGNCLIVSSGAPAWGSCGSGLSGALTDNIANAWDIQEGTNNYININTTNSSENISFGNATTNPSFNFLGSGTLTVAGAAVFQGGISVPGAGSNSERFGSSATAAGSDAVAVGNNASAGGGAAVSIGRSASAGYTGSIAIGQEATTAWDYAIAIGLFSDAGSNSLSLGTLSQGTGTHSIALGTSASATNHYSIALGSNATTTADNQFVLGSTNEYISDMYLGAGVTSASAASRDITLNATGGSGTNISGASLTLAAGRGTGTGVGGTLVFQTASAGSTGTTLNPLTTRMSIDPAGLVNIINGNLKVGDGTPSITLGGEDAYIEGSLEVDAQVDIAMGLSVGGGAVIAGQSRISSMAVPALTSGAGAFNIGNVSGTHVAFGGNDIQAKSNATTAGTLDLNPLGGLVTMGGGLSISGHLTPSVNDTYDLGSDSLRWRDLYLGGETVHIGTSTTDEGAISYDTTNNILQFGTDSTTNGDIAFFSNQLYLDKSTGNVGIGTSSPGYQLDIRNGSGNAASRINGSSYAIQYFALNDVNKWHYELGPDGDFYIVESGVAQRLRIQDSTGDVHVAKRLIVNADDPYLDGNLEVTRSLASATGGSEYAQIATLNATMADTGVKSALGFRVWSTHTSGTVDTLQGISGGVWAQGSGGTVNSAYGAWFRNDVSSGATINTSYGARVDDGNGAGSILNQYGLYVANLTKGSTSNVGAYIGGASTYSLWVDSGVSRFDGNVGVNNTTLTGLFNVGEVNTTAQYSYLDGLRISGEDATNTIWNSGRSIVISADSGQTIGLCRTSVCSTVGVVFNTTTGNLGIGAGTSPSVRLDIQGGADASLASGGYALFGATSGGNIVIDDNEIMSRSNGTASTLHLQNDGGSVAIGNAAGATLTVNGSISGTTLNTGLGNYELYAMNQNVRTSDGVTFAGVTSNGNLYVTGSVNPRIYINSTSASVSARVMDISGTDWRFYREGSPEGTAVLMTLSANGNLTVGQLLRGAEVQWSSSLSTSTGACLSTGTYNVIYRCSSSSLRYKHDVQDFTDGLDAVRQLRPVTFYYNEDASLDRSKQVGLIAEEVAAINPLFATYNPDGSVESVRYDRIAELNTNAIKELDVQVQTNDVRLTVLEQTVASLSFDGSAYASAASVQTMTAGLIQRISSLENGVFTGGITVAGPAVFSSTLTVEGDTFVRKITIAGKIVTAGAAPTAQVMGAYTGGGAVANVTGNDTAGEVSIVFGPEAAVAPGEQLSVQFVSAFGAKPRINLTPISAAAAQVRYYIEPSVTGFKVYFIDTPVPGETYSFNYFAVE